jgi:hypothetical protein
VEGRGVHRRVDGSCGELPETTAISEDERIHARSVTLSSDRFGLIARLDLIEVEDGAVVPVDYNAAGGPIAAGAYEPELVQLCVQGLILEDNSYRCDEGRSISARATNESPWVHHWQFGAYDIAAPRRWRRVFRIMEGMVSGFSCRCFSAG